MITIVSPAKVRNASIKFSSKSAESSSSVGHCETGPNPPGLVLVILNQLQIAARRKNDLKMNCQAN